MKTCAWILDNDEPCGEICEGNTLHCASHNRQLRKEAETSRKQSEKRAALLEKAKNQKPKKAISRNPKDWSNTFLCSDGTRVTQAEIVERRNEAYKIKYPDFGTFCEACGCGSTVRHAHIIPQARCKHIGKTELIWDLGNFFRAHNQCNSILENPKNPEWKIFQNIQYCLSFMKDHDPELYTKFELAAVNHEKEII